MAEPSNFDDIIKEIAHKEGGEKLTEWNQYEREVINNDDSLSSAEKSELISKQVQDEPFSMSMGGSGGMMYNDSITSEPKAYRDFKKAIKNNLPVKKPKRDKHDDDDKHGNGNGNGEQEIEITINTVREIPKKYGKYFFWFYESPSCEPVKELSFHDDKDKMINCIFENNLKAVQLIEYHRDNNNFDIIGVCSVDVSGTMGSIAELPVGDTKKLDKFRRSEIEDKFYAFYNEMEDIIEGEDDHHD